MPKKTILFLALVLLPVLRASSEAQDQKQLKYAVLSSDSHDLTHFGDEDLLWQSDGKQKLATPFLDAEKIGFMRLPQGYRTDWHPAPRKQFVMVLNGVMEVEAGDGQRRKFVAGSVLLVSDTQGHGHRTNVLGNQDVFFVWVRVP